MSEQEGSPARAERVPACYDALCSLGEIVDKLSIENVKCYDANRRILEERASAAAESREPDYRRIAALEWKARVSGEQRVALREEFNRRLAEAIQRGGIRVAPDVRTYELPPPGREAPPADAEGAARNEKV